MPEQLTGIPVNFRLIFARKIQVDIRHFVAVETEEGLKRDGKALTPQLRTAVRAFFLRQIDTATIAFIFMPFNIMAIGAQVMRRKGIYLRDVRHERDKR